MNKIKVYIVNEIDTFYLGIDMSGRPFYPTKKRVYVGFSDKAFVFLREGQNRKKLNEKVILDLTRYSPYLPSIDGEILNSYEIT